MSDVTATHAPVAPLALPARLALRVLSDEDVRRVHAAALRLLGKPDGKSAFADIPHPTMPLYTGRPWFLPLVQAYYQGVDMFGR